MGFQSLYVWRVPEVRGRLDWYFRVAVNEMPAKYLVCRRVEAPPDFREMGEDELWRLHEKLSESFHKLLEQVKKGSLELAELPAFRDSFLSVKVELVKRMVRHCNFCRWNCRVDRSNPTKLGTCQLDTTSRVSTYFHHRGEELPIRGTQGSGTIFFTSCNMRCVFCLHPYTVILTDKGLYTIEEIFEASGNEIQYCGGFVRFPNNLHTYSYDGRKVRVVKVFKHHYNGDLLKIKASHAPPIKVTPSHEMVVYDRRGRVVKKPAKDLSHTHKLVIPFPRVEKKATATMDAEQILEPVADSTHHIVDVNSNSQLQALLLSEKNMQVKRMKQQVLYYLKDNQASVAARTLSKAKNVRNYVAVPIQRIERVSYSGPVYNLEVEDESHTYTANCLAVGNCQNSDISHDKDNGVVFTPQRLAWSMWQLRMEGCHNINLVGGEPTIHLHTIVQAIDMLKFFREFDAEAWSAKADAYIPYRLDPRNASYRGEFNTPILWNSNMYMSLETLRILRELVDIWLPDFKFGNNKCAIRLSRTPWYFETVAENHRLIYGWGEDIVIRHLIMPGHVECCTKPVLKWIAENMPEVPVNVMDQYHPDAYCNPADPRFDKRYVDMARYPTREEILEAYRYAESLGLNFGEITFERSLRGFRP
jgi:uncharacterized Fe-S radical SAM superfamily protein PflX